MDQEITRRDWLRMVIGAGVTLAIPSARAFALAGSETVAITVYKDANCGCCKKWVSHLQQKGFKVTAYDRTDMDALKDSLGVPQALRSCHTAIVGKLLIEGHVPAEDIRRAMTRSPKGVVGLAVPGMPAGSPGMEVGRHADRYEVIAFSANGTTKVFASHG